MVDDFHDQWLGISKVQIVPKDAEMFPTFTEGVRFDMFNEARLFLSDVFWRGADARTIFTATDTWLTQQLADYYNAGRMPGPGHTPSTLPSGQERAGILSMGAIMATYSYHDQISPVHRGKFVRNR